MGTMQEDANEIGAAMRDLDAKAAATGDAPTIAAATRLHELLGVGYVNHLKPLGVEWGPVAGHGTASRGGAQTLAGDKHEPQSEA